MGPISEIIYTGFTVIESNDDLSAPPSASSTCGPGWDALVDKLATMRGGSSDIYVGLLPNGVPAIPVSTAGIRGCGRIGAAVAFENEGFLMAHEGGHALNRMHAKCPNLMGADVDAMYPTYLNQQTGANFPDGSIGEFGLSIGNFTVPDPATHRDVMTNCAPKWISPYTYMAMRTRILSTMPPAMPALALTSATNARNMLEEYLYLNIRVHRDGQVDVLPSFHLHELPSALETEVLSSVECNLMRMEGEVVASHRFRREPLQNPDAQEVQYHGALRWDSTAQAIEFFRDGKLIYTYNIEPELPTVSVENLTTLKDENRQAIRLEWTGKAPSGKQLEYLLRYSPDDGESWHSIAAALTEPSYVVELDQLPGGDRCRLQVVASSGVRTTTAQTPPFAVSVKPAWAHILSPVDGTILNEGEPLELSGIGFSPNFGTSSSEEMWWSSDRDGLLGTGREIFVADLSPGRHQLQLTVLDGIGGESTASVTIQVTSQSSS
jgi:hypothetical protein